MFLTINKAIYNSKAFMGSLWENGTNELVAQMNHQLFGNWLILYDMFLVSLVIF